MASGEHTRVVECDGRRGRGGGSSSGSTSPPLTTISGSGSTVAQTEQMTGLDPHANVPKMDPLEALAGMDVCSSPFLLATAAAAAAAAAAAMHVTGGSRNGAELEALAIKAASAATVRSVKGGGGKRTRRRGPLVRRTHSPKTVPSPLSSPNNSPRPFGGSPAPFPSSTAAWTAKKKTIMTTSTTNAEERATPRKPAFATSPHRGEGSGDVSAPSQPLPIPILSSPPLPPRMDVRVKLLPPNLRGISEAAGILSASEKKHNDEGDGAARDERKSEGSGGGILAFPTETVYAVGCHAKDGAAVQKLLRLKKRRRIASTSTGATLLASSVTTNGAVTSMPTVGTSSFEYQPHHPGGDIPIVHVPSIYEAKGFLKFNKPRRYALVSSGGGSGTSDAKEKGDMDRIRGGNIKSGGAVDTGTPLGKECSGGENGGASLSSGQSTGSIGSIDSFGLPPAPSPAPASPSFCSPRITTSSLATPTATALSSASALSTTCLSEGWEVLRRLATTFWPGPLVVLVPAARRPQRTTNSRKRKNIAAESDQIPVPDMCSPQAPTRTRLRENNSSNGNGERPAEEEYVLPSSILIDLPQERLQDSSHLAAKNPSPQYDHNPSRPSRCSDRGRRFVAVRCPAHPLSQKLLREAGVPVVAFTAAISSGAEKASKHLADPPLHCPIRAREVKELWTATVDAQEVCRHHVEGEAQGLRDGGGVGSPGSSSSDVENVDSFSSTTSEIVCHCINGEDKREMFTVPTCELGKPSTVVSIHERVRTVRVWREGAVILASDVADAMRRRQSPCSPAPGDGCVGDDCRKGARNGEGCAMSEASIRTNRIINGVLAKWTVVSMISTSPTSSDVTSNIVNKECGDKGTNAQVPSTRNNDGSPSSKRGDMHSQRLPLPKKPTKVLPGECFN